MTQSYGPLSPQEVQRRIEKAVGFTYEDEKAFDPKQPRDPGGEGGGRWIRTPGGSATTLDGPIAFGDFTVDGVKFGSTGADTKATPKDMKQWSEAVDRSVKKFPELRKPLGEGTPLKAIEFMTNPASSWGEKVVTENADMYTYGQMVAATTGPDQGGGTRIIVNEDPGLGDAIHQLMAADNPSGPPGGWFSPGSDDVKGQLYHELGHALVRAAGKEALDPSVADNYLEREYSIHDLSAESRHISGYADSGGPSEAFGELFATYMRGKLSGKTKTNFEAMLADMLGRKV